MLSLVVRTALGLADQDVAVSAGPPPPPPDRHTSIQTQDLQPQTGFTAMNGERYRVDLI